MANTDGGSGGRQHAVGPEGVVSWMVVVYIDIFIVIPEGNCEPPPPFSFFFLIFIYLLCLCRG